MRFVSHLGQFNKFILPCRREERPAARAPRHNLTRTHTHTHDDDTRARSLTRREAGQASVLRVKCMYLGRGGFFERVADGWTRCGGEEAGGRAGRGSFSRRGGLWDIRGGKHLFYLFHHHHFLVFVCFPPHSFPEAAPAASRPAAFSRAHPAPLCRLNTEDTYVKV